MYKLFEFIRSVYVVLLFIVIEAVAVNYYARSSCYTQARLLARTSQIAGGIHGAISGVKHYFTLGRENKALIDRIGVLETEIARYRQAEAAGEMAALLAADSIRPQYEMYAARVVSNSINKSNNFLVLNRGQHDGVTSDMAVLSAEGAMVGYVVDVSEHYAIAISALNTAFRASGKISGSEYFGSICWDGTDSRYVTMEELSKYADPKPGDEVVSTGFSQYFPADIPIGTVESADLNEARTAYTVRVRLAARMTGLADVMLLRNGDLDEVRALEQGDKVCDLNVKQ